MDICHNAETKHYVAHYGATFIEEVLQKATQTEEAKPCENRSPKLELALSIGILFCNLAKVAANSGLCNPIDKRYALHS
jgi:hypothetical protein